MAAKNSRRQRIDSAAAAVATMAAAERPIDPPKHLRLRRGDRPFWDAVIGERAKSEWSEADLAVAAQLARAMADAETLAAMTVREGGYVDFKAVLMTGAAADKLARRVVTLRRALGIDSRAKHGEQRDVSKRREIAKTIEAGVETIDADQDELLAGASTIQ